jgi:hypothetical protein
VTGCILSVVLLITPAAPPADRPRPEPPPRESQNSETAPATDESTRKIDDILTRLQRRSDGLVDIRCKVDYLEDDRINLSMRRKLGQILFLLTDPNPHFLIDFQRTTIDDQLTRREWYLFDGYWLSQGVERTKQVTRRQVARSGEKVDLFDLETAPFPLPFGQKKEHILASFDVTLRDPIKDDPPGSDHLVCVPKAGTRLADRFERVEFFVLRSLDLPGKIVAVKKGGLETITVSFPDLAPSSINSGVTKAAFDPPKEWAGYTEVVEPLEP